jgi:hypothetical protein
MANNLSPFSVPAIMDPVVLNNNISPSDSWSLPAVFGNQHASLADVPFEQLRECLQPMIAGLQQLDAESLLELHRVKSGGAILRDR